MNTYLKEFLALRCAGDVLNATHPVSKAAKEITEAMAVVKRLKSWAIQHPMELILWDLCAGNALTGILAAYLLPFKRVIAVDRKRRKRQGYQNVRRWEYRECDVSEILPEIDSNSILVASHPCGQAAIDICMLYAETDARAMAILPCCVGKLQGKFTALEHNRFSRYEQWCLGLARLVGGNCKRDNHVASPANILVWATKS